MSLLHLTSRLLSPVWQRFRQEWPVSDAFKVEQPILSMDEITDLAETLGKTVGKLSPNLKQSESIRQGEQTSNFMGAGLEYEESRPYQPGDEIRRINWRLMARTGKAYTKLFQEERQENWFILVDHRASMRFGTRLRLKATQASRIAAYFTWIAQQAGIPVATGRIAQGLEQSPTFEGKSMYSQVMQILSQPCPPINDVKFEPVLNDVLLSLVNQLKAGSRLMVISDFHDLNAQTTEVLTALQERIEIKAICVQDIAETDLPNMDGLQLQSIVNGQIYDMASASQKAHYQAWSNRYQRQIHQSLNQANVATYTVHAHESIEQIMVALSGENPQKLGQQ